MLPMTTETPDSVLQKNVPRVSIGMPVYNGEPFIREALDSLLAQTFSDFELIISDNAATDGTETICREYAEKDPRIRYVRQVENHGATANFQFVLDEAVGEYFMWAAADDRWCKSYIKKNITFLESNADYVSSTSDVIGHYDRDIYPAYEDQSGTKRIERVVGRHGSTHMFYSLYRRVELKDIMAKSFPLCRGYDWKLILLVLKKGKMKIHREWRCFNKYLRESNEVYLIPKVWHSMPDRNINYIIPFYEYSKTALVLAPTVATVRAVLKLNLMNLLIQIRKLFRILLRA